MNLRCLEQIDSYSDIFSQPASREPEVYTFLAFLFHLKRATWPHAVHHSLYAFHLILGMAPSSRSHTTQTQTGVDVPLARLSGAPAFYARSPSAAVADFDQEEPEDDDVSYVLASWTALGVPESSSSASRSSQPSLTPITRVQTSPIALVPPFQLEDRLANRHVPLAGLSSAPASVSMIRSSPQLPSDDRRAGSDFTPSIPTLGSVTARSTADDDDTAVTRATVVHATYVRFAELTASTGASTKRSDSLTSPAPSTILPSYHIHDSRARISAQMLLPNAGLSSPYPPSAQLPHYSEYEEGNGRGNVHMPVDGIESVANSSSFGHGDEKTGSYLGSRSHSTSSHHALFESSSSEPPPSSSQRVLSPNNNPTAVVSSASRQIDSARSSASGPSTRTQKERSASPVLALPRVPSQSSLWRWQTIQTSPGDVPPLPRGRQINAPLDHVISVGQPSSRAGRDAGSSEEAGPSRMAASRSTLTAPSRAPVQNPVASSSPVSIPRPTATTIPGNPTRAPSIRHRPNPLSLDSASQLQAQERRRSIPTQLPTPTFPPSIAMMISPPTNHSPNAVRSSFPQHPFAVNSTPSPTTTNFGERLSVAASLSRSALDAPPSPNPYVLSARDTANGGTQVRLNELAGARRASLHVPGPSLTPPPPPTSQSRPSAIPQPAPLPRAPSISLVAPFASILPPSEQPPSPRRARGRRAVGSDINRTSQVEGTLSLGAANDQEREEHRHSRAPSRSHSIGKQSQHTSHSRRRKKGLSAILPCSSFQGAGYDDQLSDEEEGDRPPRILARTLFMWGFCKLTFSSHSFWARLFSHPLFLCF